ncbi:nitrate reductase molybdenum cofactor assembly chaperone [Salana multivorans]|uniref:nitrate reductase molybdenum cofactor assembly chaperone n=1 Tax=Salana multivorans TaxID=120377 RepID=UPI000B2EA780|nr:nitrate reductase molybdenum cofactor assembly chaperone [Salana multivorans]
MSRLTTLLEGPIGRTLGLGPRAPRVPDGPQRLEPVTPAPRSGTRAPLPFLAPQEGLTAGETGVVHLAAALLLAYPDEGRARREEAVRAAVDGLPGQVAADLASFLDRTGEWGDAELAAHYVATFDLRRRCALHLSFYSSGDTRRRGMALVTFAEAFAAAGFEVPTGELPDHLPLVLEMSARGGRDVAAVLLAAHRQGVELLRSALHQVGSPYAAVLDAVCRTLPEMPQETIDRFLALLSEGPPGEMVGLAAPLLPFPTMRPDEGPDAGGEA